MANHLSQHSSAISSTKAIIRGCCLSSALASLLPSSNSKRKTRQQDALEVQMQQDALGLTPHCHKQRKVGTGTDAGLY